MRRVWLWCSSGKDSAWSLLVLRHQPDIEVTSLVTTVNARFDRVAMHAVRRDVLRAQAEAAGTELRTVSIPHPCPDVRSYREGLLEDTGIEPLFPLGGVAIRASLPTK